MIIVVLCMSQTGLVYRTNKLIYIYIYIYITIHKQYIAEIQNIYICIHLQYPPIDYVSCCYMCTTCSKSQGLVCYCIVTAPCIISVLTSLGNKMGEGEATHPHQQSSSSARASSQQHPKPRNYDSSANIYQTLKPAVHQEPHSSFIISTSVARALHHQSAIIMFNTVFDLHFRNIIIGFIGGLAAPGLRYLVTLAVAPCRLKAPTR